VEETPLRRGPADGVHHGRAVAASKVDHQNGRRGRAFLTVDVRRARTDESVDAGEGGILASSARRSAARS
jgi:hypothetical protein